MTTNFTYSHHRYAQELVLQNRSNSSTACAITCDKHQSVLSSSSNLVFQSQAGEINLEEIINMKKRMSSIVEVRPQFNSYWRLPY